MRSKLLLLVTFVIVLPSTAMIWDGLPSARATAITPAPVPIPQGGCVEPPDGMVSWWPGDGTAEDIIGGLDGTLENGATFELGKVDQALSFDGDDDFVSTTTFEFPTDLTIDAWIRPGRVHDAMIIATVPASSPVFPQSGLFLSAGPPGPQLRYFVDSDGWNRGYWYALYDFVAGSWYHVAVTQSGPSGSPTLYVNGVSYPVVVDLRSGTPYRAAAPLSLGRQGGFSASYFQGALDEVEIFDRALSGVEIAAIHGAGSAGKCKPGAIVEVDIDIKPGSDPNSINLKSKGNIPVAIMGSATFDTFDVDTASFGPNGASPVHGGHPEDVNDDGFMDLVFHFNPQETGIACGDPEATLAGLTLDGQQIEGFDSIRTVGCKE